MRNALERPVTPPRVGRSDRARYPRERGHTPAGALWRLFPAVLLGLAAIGCGTTLNSATCTELAGAADAARCPERVIDRPVPQLAPIEIDAPSPAPPITSAALVDPTVLEALRSVAADFKASREWGHKLYSQIMNLKRANDALLEGDGDP